MSVQSGQCRFNPCRYEHPGPSGKQKSYNQPPEHKSDEKLFAAFGAWKAQASSGHGRPLLKERLGPFFEEARMLIETDESTMQNIIRCLSTEGGLRRIQEMIQRDFLSFSNSQKTSTFRDEVLPFF